jgi:glutamyl/glutaminyl-tRNA synthetase
VRSRIAPTPSGKLHLGNIYNFILTWWYVKSIDGTLALRIDDADELRCKKEYIDNIFETLKWLEIDINDGPSSTEDFIKNFSQQNKKQYYLNKIQDNKNIFFCDCSRKQVDEHGHYKGKCFNLKREFSAGEFAIRLNLAPFYPILWRRDNIPAYHLTTLIDDQDLGITDLIRGDDLHSSTFIQNEIASLLNIKFPKKTFHHRLVTNDSGEKLSKSHGDKSVIDTYEKQEVFDFFAGTLKIKKFSRLNELKTRSFPKEALLQP